MYSVVLQDWVTIRGGSGVTSITQGENGWVGTAAYEDIIFWLDVREVTSSTGTITMNYQTAPLKDEALFTNMIAGVTMAVTTPPLTPSKVILSQGPLCPLARWVRWNISQAGATGTWDVTFRIIAACNAVSQITQ